MRTNISRCGAVLLVLLVVGAWIPARAKDALPKKAPSAAELQELQQLWQKEAALFLKQHPELKSFDRETLLAKGEALKLLHLRFQEFLESPEVLKPASGEAVQPSEQGKAERWPSETAGESDRQIDPKAASGALLPNEFVSPPVAPADVNASVAWHGTIPFEAYSVYTDFPGPPIFGPSTVWQSGTPTGGSGAPWFVFGPIPLLWGPEQWNPTIAYNSPAFPWAYFETHVEYALPALAPFSPPPGIVVNPSLGSGAPFPSGPPPALVWGAPPGLWEDFPYIAIANHAGLPIGPGGAGDITVAWVEYIDGDGDPTGDMNFYNDFGDGYTILVASSNAGAGPFPYPVFSPPMPVWGGPVMGFAHQTHRPSVSTVGAAGTPASPPAGAYMAMLDFAVGGVVVAMSPAPGLGAPWGPLAVPAVPVAFLPPVLAPGILASSSVSIAVDNGPLSPGMVYLAWSDVTFGDADIMFSRSPDGGVTWSPPVRVNQDPPGIGIDQWAPHMVVDASTGDICITYYDRRRDAANTAIEVWSSNSLTGGATWTDALVSDAGPVPPSGSLPTPGGLYVGDYLGSTADYGFGAQRWGAAWNDGRTGPFEEVSFEVARLIDSDADGIPDVSDNCPAVFNPGQSVIVSGNANGVIPVTSADIIHLVNYVFKSGAPPMPCEATGDVDCSGTVTSSDIISLVNFVFKSGAPPCDICMAFGLGWVCP
jgi:hypothetical protein